MYTMFTVAASLLHSIHQAQFLLLSSQQPRQKLLLCVRHFVTRFHLSNLPHTPTLSPEAWRSEAAHTTSPCCPTQRLTGKGRNYSPHFHSLSMAVPGNQEAAPSSTQPEAAPRGPATEPHGTRLSHSKEAGHQVLCCS